MHLKNNKITPRQIAVLIGGAFLIDFGITIVYTAFNLIVVVNIAEHPDPNLVIKGFIETLLLGLGFTIPGILLLIKSRLLRIILKLITKKKEKKP